MISVSVVMPVRNEQRFLGAAIESILTQTFRDFELIVVDDGSADRSPEILDDYAGRDRRIRVLRNPRPLGAAAALNRGIQAGRAPLIARMDGDDISLPERLERQKAFLDQHPQIVMCGTAAQIIDGDGIAVEGVKLPSGAGTLRQLLRTGNAFVHGSTMFRRREVENAGLYSHDFDRAEDYELWVRLAARHDLDNMPDVLYAYRTRDDRPGDAGIQRESTVRIQALASVLLKDPAYGFDLASARSGSPEGRILVLIASYRDVDCQWTVRDLFDRARRPEEVTVGICWQYEPRLDIDCFRIRTREDQVRTVHVHASEARGLGWARHLTERLWAGEEFVLQIDGHMRFANGWDERLKEELAACNSRYPILTVYPWGYTPPRTLHGDGQPLRMAALRFHDSHMPAFVAAPHDRPPKGPVNHAFWAGGFAFSRGDVLRQVPQDPYMYFNETEPTHGARLWTHGWDLFAPSENLIWHCYGPDKTDVRTPWSDGGHWQRCARLSPARARHLLGVEPTADPASLVDLPRYGLGTLRTLGDYERFAGISFADKTIEPFARRGECRPEFARPRWHEQRHA